MEYNSSSLLSRPTVRILFDGLFLLRFDKAKDPAGECQIGVLTSAVDHDLSVAIIETTTEDQDGKKVRKHSRKVFTLCQSTCRLLGHFNLVVRGDTSRKSEVMRYGYGDGTPLPDRSSVDDNDIENFKWILDISNCEFNEKNVLIAPGVFSPVLHVKTGIFYTYAITTIQYNAIKADVSKSYFGYMAASIGLDIELNEKEELVLQHCGGLPEWVLPRNSKATYLIHFQNVCPKCKTPVEESMEVAEELAKAKTLSDFIKTQRKANLKDSAGEPKPDPKLGHSDFQYYYDGFTSHCALDQHDFQPVPLSGAKPLVCYPIAGSAPIVEEII